MEYILTKYLYFIGILFSVVWSEEFSEYEEAALKDHNEFRAKHGVPALTLNKKLSEFAEEWAEHLSSSDRFEHRQNIQYGENLYVYWSSSGKEVESPRQAVESWYNEIELYDYANPGFSPETGHFTALIWKPVKEMGIAKNFNQKTNKTFVVAYYDPQPNMPGYYALHVKPPIGYTGKVVTFDGIDVEEFRRNAVLRINRYRKMHGMPPVSQSQKMNEDAQTWAEHLLKASGFSASTKPYGQLFTSTSALEKLAENTIDKWYAPGRKFNYAEPGKNPRSTTFLQIIWKRTKLVGFGLASDLDRYKTVIVAFFNPSASVNYEENISKPVRPEEEVEAEEEAEKSAFTSTTTAATTQAATTPAATPAAAPSAPGVTSATAKTEKSDKPSTDQPKIPGTPIAVEKGSLGFLSNFINMTLLVLPVPMYYTP